MTLAIVTLAAAALACIFALLGFWQAGRAGRALEALAQRQEQLARAQDKLSRERLHAIASGQMQLQQSVSGQNQVMTGQLHGMAVETEQKLDNIRASLEARLAAIQRDNDEQLAEIRRTVDEQLQKTLEEKLSRSFGLVSRQLEQVHQGLGEMQALAAGVGDLKKVLSGVKTRGILGEVQLGAILEQILTQDQYAENIATVPGRGERVEFALRLPGDGQTPVWLPIDAKFPLDSYNALLSAYDTADPARVEAAAKALDSRVRGFAKDICHKYVKAPYTTDFGVMFLPVEGLYAEVVRRGIADRIQYESRVIVAGPTTMGALLNSLQMGFRTLAIQQRSGEVWQVLGSVREEFDAFGAALAQAQNRIAQAGSELENLVGVRTRQIQRRLDAVSRLSPAAEESEPIPFKLS